MTVNKELLDSVQKFLDVATIDRYKTTFRLQSAVSIAFKSETLVNTYLDPLIVAMSRYQINTKQRIACFIGQAMVESTNFSKMEEGLYYTTPSLIEKNFSKARGRGNELIRNPEKLANVVYSGRLGNGSEASGDGWKFRGRGIFQLTGRANYTACAKAIGIDIVNNPDWVKTNPYVACLTAAWFFSINGCIPLADKGQISNITRIVNGPAMLHNDRRINATNQLIKNL